ncbi:MAG: response regulator [Anaerolineae bacterium]
MARILIVEDYDPIRWTLANLLQCEGYEVDQAANGRQALARLAIRQFDAILMDVYMPGMNGLEACRRVRRTSQVPILMFAAYGDPVMREEALNCGADDFIVKPMDLERLLAWIRRVGKGERRMVH